MGYFLPVVPAIAEQGDGRGGMAALRNRSGHGGGADGVAVGQSIILYNNNNDNTISY